MTREIQGYIALVTMLVIDVGALVTMNRKTYRVFMWCWWAGWIAAVYLT